MHGTASCTTCLRYGIVSKITFLYATQFFERSECKGTTILYTSQIFLRLFLKTSKFFGFYDKTMSKSPPYLLLIVAK